MSDTATIGHARVVANTTDLDRDDWLALRRKGIGGSDVSAIVGLSKYATALSVWLEKTGLYTPEDNATEAMEWGNILEPVVADEFSRRSRIPTVPYKALLAHPEHPWMLANVDRLISHDPVAGIDEPGVYEGKTTSPWQRKEWGTDDNPQIPDHAALQTHHYLAVTGLPYAYVAVLIGGQQMVWRRVERDEEMVERLIALELEFMERVATLDPPPPVEADAGLLGDVWSPEADKCVVLDDGLLAALSEREVAHQAIKAFEGAKAKAQARVQLAMGDAEYGLNGDGLVVVSWKQMAASERKASVVAAHRRFHILKTPKEIHG